MTRVLFTHRYSMAHVRDVYAAGEIPGHHLWGASALERAGFDVRYGYFGRDRPALKRLSGKLGNRLGDIEQELALLQEAGGDSVIYAGEASLLRGIVRLPRRPPLVGVVHEAAPWMCHLDVALCLSTRTRDQLIALGRAAERTPLAPWGPDLGFSGYTGATDELVVSTGKTDRDLATLRAALDGLPARIYDGELLPYPEVLADLRRAAIVAIPLARTDRVLALTEINDALALAKPIVMTRTGAIDFDPEAAGCGLTVEPHDVAGWRDALAGLWRDPATRREMGRSGRRFAEAGYNADAFGQAVVDAVRTAS